MSERSFHGRVSSVGLLRRCGALLYDTLLLCGLLLVATAFILPLTAGEAVAAGNPWFSSYLLLICFSFFGWFWTHGGQTLGMRAWKIRLQRTNGDSMGWGQALLRFLLASLWVLPMVYVSQVLGFDYQLSVAVGLIFLISMLATRFHDRYSDTVMVQIVSSKKQRFSKEK
jgi:uncharacterized RDD family membrane protein YckC